MALRRKRIDWEYHLARQKKSGLSIQEYSRQSGFSSWSFYQHRKKLHQQTRVLESKSKLLSVAHSSFIPVGTLQTGLPRITIHFPDRTRLELHAIPSPEHLECIVSALQRYSGGR